VVIDRKNERGAFIIIILLGIEHEAHTSILIFLGQGKKAQCIN
jgi:hypothetical protein